jgi:Glycosyl hydrolase family 12
MTPRRYAMALAAALLLGTLPAACASAATARLCGSQAQPVSGSAYTVQNNEWRSIAPECITTDGSASFTVTSSSLANSANGPPGGYPSIYKGCHWGACTADSGLPIQVAAIQAGTVITSWSTTQPAGGVYSVAYDIWFNRAPSTHGQPDGAELMIWLNLNGPVHPAGYQAASGIILGGRGYNVWLGHRDRWMAIAYQLTSPTTAVTGLDLQPLVADAMTRGYLQASWYLIGVEAGFEVWQGGVGLATGSFSVSAGGGG